MHTYSDTLYMFVLGQVFLSSAVKVSGRTEQQLPSYLEDEFILKCLVWHNIFRSRHQAAALRLSFPLCHEAQRLANEIAHTDRISFHESLKWPNGSCNSEDSKSPSAKLHERGFGQSLYVKYQPLLLVDSRMDVTGVYIGFEVAAYCITPCFTSYFAYLITQLLIKKKKAMTNIFAVCNLMRKNLPF